ncbi:DnaA ATPase domain-containing protein [Peribacillus muralis]|nr:DnaA/Hda family protein [Peribacillus muralis]
MDKIQEVLSKLQERTAGNTTSNHQNSTTNKDECSECNGMGFVMYLKNGYEFARECKCQEAIKMRIRYQNATIPDEYEEYTFKNFEKREDVHDLMVTKIVEYLKNFPNQRPEPTWKDGKQERFKGPSFGFIATFGEQRIKNIGDPNARNDLKRKHNNYGIGKSHLTISAAKFLLKSGYRVQVVSDPVFIQDLMTAKFNNDKGESFNNILSSVTAYADFVIWDDLGKLKWTEPREDLYYQIFNELYKQGKPVIFSSNEDIETLSDKIGQAAASRLKGMCKGFLYPVEGKDQR